MELKEIIGKKIEGMKKLIYNINTNNLDDNDLLIFNNYKLECEILENIYKNNYDLYEFILRYIFIDKCYFGITKFNKITDINFRDLYIIDNLHDFEATSRTGGTKRTKTLDNIRKMISTYLSLEMSENIIKKRKETKTIINVNSNKKFKNYIYKKYNLSKIIVNEKNKLPKYELKLSKVYFESIGLYNAKEMICPFKNILDGLECKNDTNEIRLALGLNNLEMTINNYNQDKIIFIFTGNKVNGVLDNIKYYEPFLQKIDNKLLTSITINNNEYIINNEVKTIYNKIEELEKNILNKDELKKYIMSGIFLKRIGDYSQVKLFMYSNLKYFQTYDIYCFIYSCLKCKLYKVIFLYNKVVFTRILYDNDIYDIYCNLPNNKLLNIIKEILKNMIKKNNITGGWLDIIDKKIDNYNIKNMKRKQIYIDRSKMIKYDKLFYLKELYQNIENPIYLYLYVKQNIEIYSGIFGDDFDNILNILKLYKNFSSEIKCEDLDYIKELYEGVIKLKEIINELSIEEQNYVISMELIYNKIIREIKEDKNESYKYLFDYIYNFEDYVNVNYKAENLLEEMLEAYENNYIDEYGGGLKVNPKYEKELDEFNEINEKIMNGEIEYTDEEYEKFLDKYSYLDKVAYISDEENEEEEKDDNKDKKRYFQDIIKYYDKYIKYKLKYIKLKDELNK